jgi:hypothetical protein
LVDSPIPQHVFVIGRSAVQQDKMVTLFKGSEGKRETGEMERRSARREKRNETGEEKRRIGQKQE